MIGRIVQQKAVYCGVSLFYKDSHSQSQSQSVTEFSTLGVHSPLIGPTRPYRFLARQQGSCYEVHEAVTTMQLLHVRLKVALHCLAKKNGVKLPTYLLRRIQTIRRSDAALATLARR